MADSKKRAEVHRWRVCCPRCDRELPAAVTIIGKKVQIDFECHGCGLSDRVEMRGREARRFLKL